MKRHGGDQRCFISGHDAEKIDVEGGEWKEMPGNNPPAMQQHFAFKCRHCKKILSTGMELRNAANEPYKFIGN